MIRPFRGNYPVFFPFGATDSPYSAAHPHRGNDYSLEVGHSIIAPEGGYATSKYASDFGYHTQLDTPNYVHFLAHELKGSQISDGWVKQGDFLAKSDTSGWVTGPHLHWQVLDKASGNWVNSEVILKKGDDMFEGRTAEDWANQAKDAQPYKDQVVSSVSWTKGMGQKVGNVKFIIDDLENYKATHPDTEGTSDLQKKINTARLLSDNFYKDIKEALK